MISAAFQRGCSAYVSFGFGAQLSLGLGKPQWDGKGALCKLNEDYLASHPRIVSKTNLSTPGTSSKPSQLSVSADVLIVVLILFKILSPLEDAQSEKNKKHG